MSLSMIKSSALSEQIILPANGGEWWACSDIPSTTISKASQYIQNPQKVPEHCMFKHIDRRLVFRLPESQSNCVVKAFPLIHFRHKLKYKKYALQEAKNLIEASTRQLPVVKLYAYGHQKMWGIVQWSALLMEEAKGRTMAEDLECPDMRVELKKQILSQSYPTFNALYHACCFHLDFKCDGIIMGDTNKIIDFQYVQYHQHPSPELIALQAGHFAWFITHWHKWLEPKTLDEWFSGLVQTLSLKDTNHLWKFFHLSHLNRIRLPEKIKIYERIKSEKHI